MTKRPATAVIQFKSVDFTDLKARHGDHWRQLGIDGDLRLGTNGPAGMAPQRWITFYVTVFCARAGLIAAWTTLVAVMRWLLTQLNSDSDAPPRRWPSPQLILQVLKTSPAELWASKGEYARSLVQALEALVAAVGDTVDVFSGLDLEEHFLGRGRSVVVDLSNVYPSWVRLFLTDVLLGSLLLGRMARRQRAYQTEVVVVIDECDPYVSRQSVGMFPAGMAPIERLLKLSREYGIAVILALSDLGDASRMVLNNVQNVITCKLTHELSIAEAVRTLSLPAGGGAAYHDLRPGECLVRCDGPWPHAMLGKIDYVPPAEVEQPLVYDTHPFTPAKTLEELPEVYRPLQALIENHRKRKTSPPKASPKAAAQPDVVSPLSLRLLSAAIAHPWHPVVDLWRRLPDAPHFEAQKRVYEELTAADLAVIDDVRIGRTTYALIEVTEAGYRRLKVDPPRIRGRGKLVHRTFSHWLAMVGRKRGHKVEIEWLVPGTSHPADCAWLCADGRWVVWEVIATAEHNLISHIQACLQASRAVAHVNIATAQKTIARRLQQQLQQAPAIATVLDRVNVEPIEPYMKEGLS